MLLIGLGLIGRLNGDSLGKLLDSAPVDGFFRILATYFLVSALLQASAHWRDLHLTAAELDRWWGITRTNLPGDRVRDLLHEGISRRKRTFFVALGIVFLLNCAVAVALWHWKAVLQFLLSP